MSHLTGVEQRRPFFLFCLLSTLDCNGPHKSKSNEQNRKKYFLRSAGHHRIRNPRGNQHVARRTVPVRRYRRDSSIPIAEEANHFGNIPSGMRRGKCGMGAPATSPLLRPDTFQNSTGLPPYREHNPAGDCSLCTKSPRQSVSNGPAAIPPADSWQTVAYELVPLQERWRRVHDQPPSSSSSAAVVVVVR